MIRRPVRRMVRAACGVVAVALLAPVGLPRAQQAATPVAPQAANALPSGRDVIARYVEAIGGAEAIAGTTSWRARGTFELPGQGITGTLDILSARPARSRVTLEVPGVGTIESGYDGEVAWIIDPVSGPALLTGRALTQSADDAVFDAALHSPDFTPEVTTVERLEFDARPAYKLRVVYASGREQVEYYDVETGFQIGTEGSRETPLGYVPSTTYLRNYKAFGPMMQATEIVQRPLGIEQVVRIQSFDFDVVEADAFALPPQIQALVKR